MQILLDVAVIIINILIALGDALLSASNFIKKAVLKIFKTIFFVKKLKKKSIKIYDPKQTGTKIRYFASGLLFSLVFIFIPFLFLIFIQDLPNPRELTQRPIPQTTRLYDRNGKLLYEIYASENRSLVPLSEVPKTLQQATIAIEDKDFYNHPGFDIFAIIRSAVKNIKGEGLQGGSTITQQLIKSTLLSSETTIIRKVKELVLAFWAERIYTKNQVLEMYLNQVPYGGTAWGIEAACETYFGKNVKDLSLAESAFLAGIPKAPTIYSPYGANPNLWKNRQKDVLNIMARLGYIKEEEMKKALEEQLVFRPLQTPINAAHFVMYVRELLVQKYGLSEVERGGLNITTTLDLNTQEMAENIVKNEVLSDAYLSITNGAALITNPSSGDILAMVGSHDYNDPNGGNVNVATSLRQPGSSIKVVTYAAALSSGFTAATILDDSPITYTYKDSPSYSPVNYDGKFRGKVSLRMAFANSLNIPAVKTLNQIGVPAMIDFGRKMGITTWNNPQNYGLSITLGGADITMVDLATVYGTIANNGIKIDSYPILKITDYAGHVLEEKKPSGKRVLDQGVSFIISDILADNNARSLEFGPNSPLVVQNHRVSVKTGTSDNKRDNWTIGYTPLFVVAAWVGNNDNSPMNQQLASGITGAAPIWNKIMTNLLKDLQDAKTEVPIDIIEKPCIGRKEYFIKGTENSINCNYIPPSPTSTPN